MKTLTDAIAHLERHATAPHKKALLIVAREVQALQADAEVPETKPKGGKAAKVNDGDASDAG